MKKLKLLMLSISLLTAQQALAQALTSMRYGVEAEYPPFESKTADGKLVGFDIEVGKVICRDAQLKCSWVQNSFDTLIPALKARKFDVINSSMDITPQRAKAVAFTHPIYQVPTMLIARKGSGLLPTVASLRGKNVGVLQGSSQEAFAIKVWQPKGVTITSYKDQNQVYSDLSMGRLDATLVMSSAGQSGFLDKPEGKDFSFVGRAIRDPKVFGPGVGFALRKDDTALRNRLNKAIKQVQKDGTLHRLSMKYLHGVDVNVNQ
ncbi:MAG: Lysine/arginine/ornithine-binding periplasmic protein [Candidatus Celerinatantimonas neptuna]|nr:MAG: Lysine/arginine/ornithine-binding periplasmic protein [Candidatus Celerinatantimonas neptuna]